MSDQTNPDTTISPSDEGTPAGHGGGAAQDADLTPTPSSDGASSSDDLGETIPGEGYWQGRDIPKEDQVGFDYLGTVLHANGVSQPVGNAFVDWLTELAVRGGEPPATQGSHGYDTSRLPFNAADDLSIREHGLHWLKAAGATQRDVEAICAVLLDAQKRIEKREARAAQTVARSGVPLKSANELDLASIREVMKRDPKRYFRDEAMQSRYRALLGGAR